MVHLLLAQTDASTLTLPLTIVASLLSAVAGGAASWAVAKRRIEELERRASVADKRLDDLDTDRERHALDIQAIKLDVGYLRGGMERVELKLDRLLSREDT